MKKLFFMLLISVSCFSQKVDVFNQNGEKLNSAPIEKKEVPNALIDAPDGDYFIIEVKAEIINGKYFFKKCRYRKITNTSLV